MRHGGYGNDVFRTERPTERSLHINGNAVQPQPEQSFVLARRYDIGRTVIHLASRGGKEDQFLPYGTGFAREIGIIGADDRRPAGCEVRKKFRLVMRRPPIAKAGGHGPVQH